MVFFQIMRTLENAVPPGAFHRSEAVTDTTIIPGWTLRPGDRWYRTVGDQLEDICKANVQIADMPNPDRPDPIAWRNKLDGLIPNPYNHLIICHSLGFITAWNWAADHAERDPEFRLGGLVVVAGNVTPVGFKEIAPHFDLDFDKLARQAQLLRQRIRYEPQLLYGLHDQFVSPQHGLILARLLGCEVKFLNEAHFSDHRIDPDIPPCEDMRGRIVAAHKQAAPLYNEFLIGRGKPPLPPDHELFQSWDIPRTQLRGWEIVQAAGKIILCSKAAALRAERV